MKDINEILLHAKFIKQKGYWGKKLSPGMTGTEFLLDYSGERKRKIPVPAQRTGIIIPPGLCRQVIAFSKHSDLSLYIVLLSVLKLLIYRYGSSLEITVMSPIYTENITGDTLNDILYIRDTLDPEKTFIDLLLEVKESVLGAYENQDYPSDKLIEYLFSPEPVEGPPSISNVLCWLKNIHDHRTAEEAFKKEKDKLIFSFMREEDQVSGYILYSPAIYEEGFIRQVSRHFVRMLENSLRDIKAKISGISLSLDEESQRLIEALNRTSTEYPREKTLHQLFEEQVEKNPDRTALVCSEGTRGLAPLRLAPLRLAPLPTPISISYRELNNKSNQWARWLREKGIKPDRIVGLMAEGSLETLPGILAILKAGGAFLPIDPRCPWARKRWILEDSDTTIVITQQTELEMNKEIHRSISGGNILLLDHEIRDRTPGPGKGAAANPEAVNHPGDLAYVIYTSGTTGKPKGVMIEHRNAVNYTWWAAKTYVKNEKLDFPLYTSVSFDLTVTSIFTPLVTGNRVVVYEYEEGDKELLIQKVINENRVGVIKATPSHLRLIQDKKEKWIHSSLKRLIVGGEDFPAALAREVNGRFPSVEIYNEYGPTEATVGCMIYKYDPGTDDRRSVPIGIPADNVQIYLLDQNRQPVPPGIPGEIHIAGHGVARGYLNRPELTSEKFCLRRPGGRFLKKLPPWTPRKNFSSLVTAQGLNLSHMSYMSYKLYKTGDLGRMLLDGNIEFLGRIDQQVKIRGYRIEPAEIRERLVSHFKVKDALAMVRENKRSEKYLCAYIVPQHCQDSQPGDLDSLSRELKEYLSGQLPDYMIPVGFAIINRIPLTPNGKIDEKVLPVPEIKVGSEYEPPRHQIDEKLVRIWEEVFNRDGQLDKSRPIGIDDNFFELGGHSLTATIMSAKIYKTLNVEIPLTEIFKTPTIREISQYIQAAEKVKFVSLEPVEEKEYYELSSAQKRVYFIQQLDQESTGYNIPVAFKLEGELDIVKLTSIFKALIQRHDSFRTSFLMINGEPVQKVNKEVVFEIEHHQLLVEEEKPSPLNCQGRGEVSSPGAMETIIRGFIRPFDLSLAPLLRVGLIKPLPTPVTPPSHPSQEGKSILMVDMHHIVSDGISSDILVREFMALYAGEKLPGLRLQYKDYSEWQTREKQRGAFFRQETYWKQQFTDEIPLLALPTDFKRPAVQAFDGDHMILTIGKEAAAALKSIALAKGTTLYMVLLAIYYIFLSRLCSQEDINVGTPTAGRRHPDLELIIGMFVNTLVLRNYPQGEKSFQGFLKEIKERTLKAFDNQDWQYEDLVEHVLANRDTNRNPLFDTMFVLQDTTAPIIRVTGLKLTPITHQGVTSKFDLVLIGEEVEEMLSFTFEYSTRLFTAATIRRFTGYFNKIVDSIIEDPTVKLAEIEIISEEEKQQILKEFNHIQDEYPRDKTLHRLFEEQVERIPDHAALIEQIPNKDVTFGENVSITYRELNEGSKRLAYLLQERGVKPGMLVGILVNRSLEMMVGILGILKTGSSYVPLNPNAPAARKKYILDECNVRILLIAAKFQVKVKDEVEERSIEKIDISQRLSSPASTLTLTSTCQVSTANLAYFIFTSGSMGKPKGVPITHTNICPLLHWGYQRLGLNHRDHVLQNLSYYFDWSVWEIFITLTSGSGLYITAEEVLLNPAACLKFMLKNDITVLHITPTQFQATAKAAIDSGQTLKTLEHLYIGAEKLTYHLVESSFALIKEDCRLFNMYGPTEASIMSAVLEIHKSDYVRYKEISSIPIGKSIANAHLLVLDKNLNMCPVNITGELYISGDGLTSGYLNQPELTAEKFIKMSNMSYLSHKSYIYKSGDLACWLPDGNIEFLGRIDLQVKIRGYRIELGEIEKRLSTHEKIKQAAVIVIEKGENSSADKYLCAYLVADKDIDTIEVKKYLSRELPDYMVPPYFVILDRLPLNPNGKIDRRALPVPETAAPNSAYAAPSNEIEKKLIEIWRQLLKVEKIGIHDDFFASGGHSLKVLNLVNAIQKEFDVKINFQDIFLYPTVAELYDLIRQSERIADNSIENQPDKEYYNLSHAQKRMWLLYQLDPDNPAFNLPTRITLYDRMDETNVRRAVEKLVERHESFRTYFKNLKGGVLQIIQRQIRVNLEIFDITDLDEDARKGKRNRLQLAESLKPFQLDKPPLFRVKLIKCKDREFDVILTMHHIITDGWSMEILEHEFLLLYESYKAGTACELQPLKLRYIDYISWQENLLADREKIAGAKEFWEKQLKGNCPVLDLPYDFPRKNMTRKESAAYRMVISTETTAELEKIARNRDASLFMLLLAAFDLLLHRVTGQNDILLAIPAAARQHEDLKNLVGFFVNTLIIKNQINPGETFNDFLAKVQNYTLQALEYQSFPLELLCTECKLRYPEISVFFNMPLFRYTQQEDLKDDGVGHVETVQDAKFDMVCYLGKSKQASTIETHYYKELFKPITIEKIMRLYQIILEDIARNPEKQIGEYQYSLTREKRKLKFSHPNGE